MLYWVAHSGFCIKWSPMAEPHCWWVTIDLILHFCSGRIFVGCCFLRIKLGTCWLILFSKLKYVRPTYRQSQRHTYSYTTILCWMEGTASLWMDGWKDFSGWEKDSWFNCSETMLNRKFNFVLKLREILPNQGNLRYTGHWLLGPNFGRDWCKFHLPFLSLRLFTFNFRARHCVLICHYIHLIRSTCCLFLLQPDERRWVCIRSLFNVFILMHF